MARPTKWRKVEFIPNIQYFAPLDIDTDVLEENILRVEELEALRLRDVEGLEQEDCARKMEISRQTFQRILSVAREKVADSLINGKAIRIEGGNFTRNICPVKCLDCGKEWSESYENFERILQGTYNCPDCNSKRVVCSRSEKKKFCRRNCWRHDGGSQEEEGNGRDEQCRGGSGGSGQHRGGGGQHRGGGQDRGGPN